MLDKNSTLVMIGDSITDCGRNYDAKPAEWGSFGDGYVSLVNAALIAFKPEYKIMVINKGISGNTIRDLKGRWQEDVLNMNPDYVSIMIGVNDAWRHFDSAPFAKFNQIEPSEYESVYRELIEKTLPHVKGIYILPPYIIEPDKNEPMSKLVREFGAIGKKLSEEYSLKYIDVQEAIDTFLEKAHSYVLSQDRVHPVLQGHMILAKTFLDGIGFTFE